MNNRVVVPLAQGFEEIEAVTIIDILRRAGVEVVVAGVTPDPVEGRTKIRLLTDRPIDQISTNDFDMIVLPGGSEGTAHLGKSAAVRRLLTEAAGQGKYLAAICAAPSVLSAMGLLEGKRATSHPSFEVKMSGGAYSTDRVVIDGKIITSRGPGTSMEFAMALVEVLCGKEKVEEINRGVLAT